MDRLNIVAHDRFQEIIDDANDPDNPLRLKQLILDAPENETRLVSVEVGSNLDSIIRGEAPTDSAGTTYPAPSEEKFIFNGVGEQEIAEVTQDVINSLKDKPGILAMTSAASRLTDTQKSARPRALIRNAFIV